MRLIFVTQVLDPADPVLGASADLVRELAIRCDRLAVVANEVRSVPSDLDAEVISLGKEEGAGRAMRGLRYQRAVAQLSRLLPADALFAHMCPVYLSMAAPIAKALGVRTILWYVHPAQTVALHLAHRLADAILTALPGSYPLPGRKVHVIGHAIDLAMFPYLPPAPRSSPLELLALGRTSPSKGFTTIIRSVAAVQARGIEVRLSIVGPSTTDEERAHRRSLEALVGELGLADVVRIEPAVPRSEVPGLLRRCDVLVDATVAGSGDKVVFEAMAVGRPVVASNPSFGALLADLPVPVTFAEGDEAALAGRIRSLTDAPVSARMQMARELRRRVEREHSLEHWAAAVHEAVFEDQRYSSRGSASA